MLLVLRVKIAPEASGVVVRVSHAPSDPRAVSRAQSVRQKPANRVNRVPSALQNRVPSVPLSHDSSVLPSLLLLPSRLLPSRVSSERPRAVSITPRVSDSLVSFARR